jgi:glycosyltransferase involved in cell wall biosynthesis
MTKQTKVVAMVQLPPPMHGAAQMNRHAVAALANNFDLHIIEMRFARTLSALNRFSLRKVGVAMWLILQMIRALPRADALYISFAPTGFAYYRDCLYVLVAKLFGVPAILHLHGRGLPAMRRSRWSKTLQQLVFKDQTVILLGERLRPEIEGLQCHSSVINNCLDTDAFLPPSATPWSPHDPVRLLWLSNLFKAKGIETLIAACATLRAQGTNCHLTIAGANGDIEETDLLSLLNRYQMQDATTVLGAVPASSRQATLQYADLFIFPSHYANEAQPLVVLEAMAAGVPVIATDIATLPEFIQHNATGFLCPPNDPARLAKMIKHAIHAQAMVTNMRDDAYKLCCDTFNQDKFAARLVELVHDVVEKR